MAKFMIGSAVEYSDFVVLLRHLHIEVPKNIGNGLRPALIAGRGLHRAYQCDLAVLLHYFRCLGLQDRIAVITDQVAPVARTVAAANPIRYRTWAGRWWFK